MDYSYFIGKKVSILLSQNMIVDGIITNWNNFIEIQSQDKSTTTIIMNPKDDIKLIKIFNNHPITVNNHDDAAAAAEYDMKNLQIKGKNLSELKKELIKEEREEIANKIKNHQITNPAPLKYDNPKFFYKK